MNKLISFSLFIKDIDPSQRSPPPVLFPRDGRRGPMLSVRPVSVDLRLWSRSSVLSKGLNALLFPVAPSLPAALSQACPACLCARAVHQGAWTECK